MNTKIEELSKELSISEKAVLMNINQLTYKPNPEIVPKYASDFRGYARRQVAEACHLSYPTTTTAISRLIKLELLVIKQFRAKPYCFISYVGMDLADFFKANEPYNETKGAKNGMEN